MKFQLRMFCQALLLFCLCQCSNYSRKFEAALANQTSTPKDLTGAWEGTWHSESSTHHGKLQAIVTPLPSEGASQKYHFHYRATWAGFLSGRFKTFHEASLLDKKQDSPTWKISGVHPLPWYYGGTYSYRGKATPLEFESTYRCDYDKGRFILARPAKPQVPR